MLRNIAAQAQRPITHFLASTAFLERSTANISKIQFSRCFSQLPVSSLKDHKICLETPQSSDTSSGAFGLNPPHEGEPGHEDLIRGIEEASKCIKKLMKEQREREKSPN